MQFTFNRTMKSVDNNCCDRSNCVFASQDATTNISTGKCHEPPPSRIPIAGTLHRNHEVDFGTTSGALGIFECDDDDETIDNEMMAVIS